MLEAEREMPLLEAFFSSLVSLLCLSMVSLLDSPGAGPALPIPYVGPEGGPVVGWALEKTCCPARSEASIRLLRAAAHMLPRNVHLPV